ncbi:MAG: GNAT family N-acetyltransferase [Corallococcus sp.]|nr:GNAT family N-acetyltransferase [Corallococcus sp.]MCM1360114.1 GNAT family N-acetyltransferase [Corallococcus sp.]MCM1395671.1 GNAT family N-acetyltransferase [Corallococcus sp.]
MITLQRIITNEHMYAWAMKLLKVSFPAEERRDDELQRQVMRHPDYRLCAIMDGNEAVGVVGYFDALDFIYFENFCIVPDKRNGGFGSATLRLLTENLPKPFILEAELPVDDITRRRIAFYKRNGMEENPYAHIQPHYRAADPDLPLLVLSYGAPLTQPQYDAFRAYLDANVDVKTAKLV